MGNRYGGGGYGNNYGGGYTPYNLGASGDDMVTPQQAAPGAAQGSFQQRLNQIVSRAAGDEEEIQILENANIVPDERSNKLLIFANKRDMAMITNIVSKVDVMLAQVLIEAIILEVTLGDSFNVGVSAVQHPKQFGEDFTGGGNIGNGPDIPGVFTNITSSGFTYFGKDNSAAQAALRWIGAHIHFTHTNHLIGRSDPDEEIDQLLAVARVLNRQRLLLEKLVGPCAQ